MFKFLMEEASGGQDGGGAAGSGGNAAPPNIADGNGVSGAAQQPVGDGGSNAGGGGGNDRSWLESLPDDIKSDPSLAVYKDVGGLAKAYVNAQKLIGANKVVIPTDKSTEEEWNAFYQKLGRPENPDKYDIKAPDGKPIDPNATKGFRDVAFKLGLSPKQVAGLAEWNHGAAAELQKNSEAQKLNETREAISNYAKKLGGEDKYKARVDEARVAVRSLATPELSEFLRTSGLGSRPEMIEFFATLKGMMAEDQIRDGTGVPFNNEDPAVLQNEIQDIEKKLFADINNPSRHAWIEQRSKLYDRLSAAQNRPA